MSERAAGETVAEAQRRCARSLAAAGIDDAGNEARRLISLALGLSTAQLVGASQATLKPEQQSAIDRFLARRLCHEPLSRIAGQREFYGRVFRLGPATLDPRPDTETLVTGVLELLAQRRQEAVRILDIGTGTGALILTLLAELPRAQGVATDISADALAVAQENAQALGVADRVRLVETDLVQGLSGPFDIAVSNPPYIASAAISGLDPEVRDYDPALALDGGVDGLDFYRRLATALPGLVPRGDVFLEVGFDQADAVADLLTMAGFAQIRFLLDVAGIRRVVAARTRIDGYP